MKAPQFFILSLLLFLSYPLQFAGAGLALDPDAQFEYANECFSNQEYLRAADEYSRFIYFFPENERVEEARYQIGMSYFRAGQFQAAIDTCRKSIDGFETSDFARKSYFLISSAHMALDQPGDAIVNLNNLLLLTEDVGVRDQINYALGWIYLELRWPLNHRPEPGVLEAARRHFKNISQQNRDTYRVEALLSDIDRLGSVPQKSPVLAGSLSIIPGAGQLYCKRYKDALTAFLLNGVLALAAYEAFDNESYALGSLITFVGLGFYAGNIYGAVSSAHKYNRKTGRDAVENLKKNMNVGVGFADKKVFLSFQYRF